MSRGVDELETGSWKLGVGETSPDFADDADCGEVGGWTMEDGSSLSAVTGDTGDKPIFNGVRAAGGIWEDSTVGDLSLSGKFGKAGADASGANFSSLGALGVVAVDFTGSA